jgi:hypothetical protein
VLRITRPLPLGGLAAAIDVGDYDGLQSIEGWTISASLDDIWWPFGEPYCRNYKDVGSDYLHRLRLNIDDMIRNAKGCGYAIETYEWCERTWLQPTFKLVGHASWGAFIITVKGGNLYITPYDEAKPENIRPYLELLSTLVQRSFFDYVLAKSQIS